MQLSSQSNHIWNFIVRLFILGFLASSTVGCFGGGDDEEMSDDIEIAGEESPAEFGEELASVDSESAGELDVSDLEEEQSSLQEESMIPGENYDNATAQDMAAPPAGSEDPMAKQNSGASPTGSFEYKIKRGDWLSKIAIKVYGDMSMWPEIAGANKNKISNPDLIYADDKIMVPIINAQSEEFATSYQMSQAKTQTDTSSLAGTYTVRKGDTLSSIAKKLLGTASKWKQLTTLNPEVKDVTQLQIGTVLRLTDTTA